MIIAAAGLIGQVFIAALEFDTRQGLSPPMSSAVTLTTTALLAMPLSRRYRLMPLVTTRPSSEAAPTTTPPGHMQKE